MNPMNNERQLREKGLTTVFESVGIVLFTLLQLKDIHCLFRTSRGFNVFLYQLLRGIAHSTKNTIGSQGSGFDGSLISYVRSYTQKCLPSFSLVSLAVYTQELMLAIFLT